MRSFRDYYNQRESSNIQEGLMDKLDAGIEKVVEKGGEWKNKLADKFFAGAGKVHNAIRGAGDYVGEKLQKHVNPVWEKGIQAVDRVSGALKNQHSWGQHKAMVARGMKPVSYEVVSGRGDRFTIVNYDTGDELTISGEPPVWISDLKIPWKNGGGIRKESVVNEAGFFQNLFGKKPAAPQAQAPAAATDPYAMPQMPSKWNAEADGDRDDAISKSYIIAYLDAQKNQDQAKMKQLEQQIANAGYTDRLQHQLQRCKQLFSKHNAMNQHDGDRYAPFDCAAADGLK